MVREDTLRDEILVEQARNGNEEAFALLVERCLAMVNRQAACLRSVYAEAEDLAQEGLMGLLSAVHTYRPETGTAFRTYAGVCVRNRMVSAVRRSSPSAEVSFSPIDEAVELPAGEAEQPASLIDQKEDTVRLTAALKQLLTETEYRVLMQYLNAHTYREIADRLAISTKTVDNALQRVRRKLSDPSLWRP